MGTDYADQRFYDIAWGGVTKERPRGIIAGGLENGSLDLWDAEALINNSGYVPTPWFA